MCAISNEPQGSEQPICNCADWGMINHTADCPVSRALMNVAPLPNPSADEEVERIASHWEEKAIAFHNTKEAIKCAILEREAQLRQQHNAEREQFIESAVARDKKADEDRDAYESLINELKAQLEAARTQCALRSAGHDDLRTRLNKANAQKTVLYFENSDALAELQQLRASLAEKEESLQEVSRSKVVGDQLNAKYIEEIEELKAEVKRAWRAAGQYRSQLAGD